jgi:hypothetical protein
MENLLSMHARQTETRATCPRAKRTRYRIVNHQEAGVFDSMTGANIWALKNITAWDWQIEPVAGTILM